MRWRACVIAALFAAPIISFAEATMSDSEILHALLGPRPDIKQYQQHDTFVADLLAWQRLKGELEARLARGEQLLPPSPATPRDWHHVTGPEDLDIAIENAEGYEQPHYQEPRRFDRTTHVSFPLAPLQQQQLSENALSTPQSIIPNTAEDAISGALLEESQTAQRTLSAAQTGTAPPQFEMQRFSSQTELR